MLGEDCRAVVIFAGIAPLNSRLRLARKWAHYVREHVVRQPAHTIVVGLTCPYPVTRKCWVTLCAGGGLTCVIPYREEAAIGADGYARLPIRPASCIGVQLQRRAKGLSLVSGANVIDVGRVASCAVLVIDIMNNAVESRRLSPAFVSPEATVIRKHTS